MESELINYILELCDGQDCVCVELHEDEEEREFCSRNCENLNEMCVRRLMYKRIIREE